ncbi:MAG: DUF481 domain-containing protein [Verrucomicrobiota bacterium]|nr:DUF481 domain-containing protein [Verrucomicrobiota bacterium]
MKKTSKIAFIALAWVVFAIKSVALTAIPNPNPPKPVPCVTNQPPLWSSSISVGLTLTRGNSDTTLGDITLKTHRNNLTNEWTLGLEATYGVDHGAKNNESLQGIAQYNHLFTDRFYGYGRINGFHDAIADVTYRLTAGPGVGYYLIKHKKTRMAIEAGPVGVFEKLDGRIEDYPGARVAQRFERKWNEHARFWETVDFIPRFDELNDYLINAEIGAQALISKRISLNVVLEDNYIAIPAPSHLDNDMKLISGLIFKF